jgi:RNA polymerase sigma-70 factor (ECF subfamily)
VGDEAACEDIVQETLIKALRGLHGFRGDAAFFTWLCQIARSQMNTWYQRNGRHIQNETPLEDDDGGWQDGILLNRTDDAEVTHNLVLRTLAGLPENYRGVLEMKYFDGLSVSQIAGLLATGEVAVQSLLARARKAFRTGFNTLTENATP